MATEIPSGDQTREMKEEIAGARSTLREAIGRGTERASELKDAAMERAAQMREAAMNRGRSAMSTIERAIDERPLAVIGGVFASGLILGWLLSRR